MFSAGVRQTSLLGVHSFIQPTRVYHRIRTTRFPIYHQRLIKKIIILVEGTFKWKRKAYKRTTLIPLATRFRTKASFFPIQTPSTIRSFFIQVITFFISSWNYIEDASNWINIFRFPSASFLFFSLVLQLLKTDLSFFVPSSRLLVMKIR